MNRQLPLLIESILRNSRTAPVIVLQGDHAQAQDWTMRACTGRICANDRDPQRDPVACGDSRALYSTSVRLTLSCRVERVFRRSTALARRCDVLREMESTLFANSDRSRTHQAPGRPQQTRTAKAQKTTVLRRQSSGRLVLQTARGVPRSQCSSQEISARTLVACATVW